MNLYQLQHNITKNNYKAGAISGLKAAGFVWSRLDDEPPLKVTVVNYDDLPASVQALDNVKDMETHLIKCFRYIEGAFVRRPQDEIQKRGGVD